MELFYDEKDKLQLFSASVAEMCDAIHEIFEDSFIVSEIIKNLRSQTIHKIRCGTRQLIQLLAWSPNSISFLEVLASGYPLDYESCALLETAHETFPLVIICISEDSIEGQELSTPELIHYATEQFTKYVQRKERKTCKVPVECVVITTSDMGDLKYISSVCKNENIDSSLYHIDKEYKLVLNFHKMPVEKCILSKIGILSCVRYTNSLVLSHLNEHHPEDLIVAQDALSIIDEFY